MAPAEGAGEAPGLAAADGDGDGGAKVGSTALTPPPAGIAEPGVVMMNTVSPGKTNPSRRACSSSQATLLGLADLLSGAD